MDDGFNNLKKALERFREHENSVMHKEAVLNVAAIKSTGIGAQLCEQLERDQKHHQSMLMKLISCIKYLARQGLPFRGHIEDAEGNSYQLLLLEARDNTEMKAWFQ